MSNSDIKIAYLILAHKNPKQINVFIKQILSDENDGIYIHVDKKSQKSLTDKLIKHERIKILKDSLNISWGGTDVANGILLLLKQAVSSAVKYDYICLNSGQDLIVNKGLKQYLTSQDKKVFITANKVASKSERAAFVNIKWPLSLCRLYDSIHPYRVLRYLMIKFYPYGINIFPNQIKLPNSCILYHGDTWFMIPFSVAEYILRYLDKSPDYYETFRNSLCTDEMFFNTIIMNSPYSKDVIQKCLVYLNFGKSYQDKNHPVILNFDDIEEIEKSGNFFARKFDIDIDSKVIDYFGNKIIS